MNKKVILIIKLVLMGIGLLFCLVPLGIALFSGGGLGEFQSHLFLPICFGCLALGELIEIVALAINKEKIPITSIILFVGLIALIIGNLV